jgi:GNAT superfamily N-acetyltransferase
MGVRREFQKQGTGLALMRHLLAWLDQQGVQQVLLDASPVGQPLYEKLGFVAGESVYVLQRQAGLPAIPCPSEVQFIMPQDLGLITAIDKPVFGADRSQLLQALRKIYPERAFLLRDIQGRIGGYLFAQEKRIGPWVMEDAAGGELLLRAALSLPFRRPVSAVVPGENPEAIALLQRYGFELVRVNRHMMRGSIGPVGRREKVYTQASLSLG